MTSRPPEAHIDSASAAAHNAAAWMRYWGLTDAEVTPEGPDRRDDITSARASAQVKFEEGPVRTRALIEFSGAQERHSGKQLLVFSDTGFDPGAMFSAGAWGIALFKYDHHGAMKPQSPAASQLVGREPPEVVKADYFRDAQRELPYPGPRWWGRNWRVIASIIVSLALLRLVAAPSPDATPAERVIPTVVLGLGAIGLWLSWRRDARKRAMWRLQRTVWRRAVTNHAHSAMVKGYADEPEC